MKLTREELLHATNKQLESVGITRQGNAGWLKATLLREFTPDELKRFEYSARRDPKPTQEPGRPFCGRRRLEKAAKGTLPLL